MTVREILRAKGSQVLTAAAAARVAEVARLLVEHNVGAAVCVDERGRVVGILSERDIVRGLCGAGAAVLDQRADELMSPGVVTCSPDDAVSELMATMTHRRIRHLPVLHAGQLAGIVSIGDLVKSRLEETESEANSLREYITAR